MFGAIEAGGTKFICGVGTGPEDLRTVQIATTNPQATVEKAVAFFHDQGPLRAVGIGSFGPVDLRTGHITSTPKPGWQNFDFAGAVRAGLGVPVGFDTDTNAAALGEARWGAAQGIANFLYVTVGTGIGGGAVANGQLDLRPGASGDGAYPHPARSGARSVPGLLSVSWRLPGGSGLRSGDGGPLGMPGRRNCRRTIRRGRWRRTTWRWR